MGGHWVKRPDPDETGHDVYDFVFDAKPRHKKKFTAISWMSGEVLAEFDDGQEAKRFADSRGFISFAPHGTRQHHPRAYIENRDRVIVYHRQDWEAIVAIEHPEWPTVSPLDEEYHTGGKDLIGG